MKFDDNEEKERNIEDKNENMKFSAEPEEKVLICTPK